jgi:hypothetical protein
MRVELRDTTFRYQISLATIDKSKKMFTDNGNAVRVSQHNAVRMGL